MNATDCYDLVEGRDLFQGDLLKNCPAFVITGLSGWPVPRESPVGVEGHVFDLVVMTQSCDLENDRVRDVLLAQLVPWPEMVRREVARGSEFVKSSKFRKLLVD